MENRAAVASSHPAQRLFSSPADWEHRRLLIKSFLFSRASSLGRQKGHLTQLQKNSRPNCVALVLRKGICIRDQCGQKRSADFMPRVGRADTGGRGRSIPRETVHTCPSPTANACTPSLLSFYSLGSPKPSSNQHSGRCLQLLRVSTGGEIVAQARDSGLYNFGEKNPSQIEWFKDQMGVFQVQLEKIVVLARSRAHVRLELERGQMIPCG